jgi:hypothetical protein
MYLSSEGMSIGWRTSPAIIAIRKIEYKDNAVKNIYSSEYDLGKYKSTGESKH